MWQPVTTYQVCYWHLHCTIKYCTVNHWEVIPKDALWNRLCKKQNKKITAVCNYLQHSPLKHYVKHKFKEFHCGINLLLWSVSNDLLKKQKCWTGNCFGLPVLCHWRFTILSVYLHSFLCDFFYHLLFYYLWLLLCSFSWNLKGILLLSTLSRFDSSHFLPCTGCYQKVQWGNVQEDMITLWWLFCQCSKLLHKGKG